MAVLLLTVLVALWATGAIVAISLCVASGRADRDAAATARVPGALRLVSSN